MNGEEAIASGDVIVEGTVLTVIATPDYAKQIDAIVVNGNDVASEYDATEGYSFEVTAVTAIDVVFGDLQCDLTYTCTGNGQIEVWSSVDEATGEAAGEQYANGAIVPLNGELYIFPIPAEGEEIVSISINGETTGVDGDLVEEFLAYGSIYYLVSGDVNIEVVISDYTGIEDASADAVSVYAADGSIFVNGFEGTAQVVNISGQVVKEFAVSGNAKVTMPQGIYFVVTGNKVAKVVIK